MYRYLAAGKIILLVGTRKFEVEQLIESEYIGTILEHKKDMDNVKKYINMLFSVYNYYLDSCKRIGKISESNDTSNYEKNNVIEIIGLLCLNF